MPNVLIMPTPLRHRAGPYREILREAGFTPLDPPGFGKLTESDLHATLPESDALLAWGGPITAEMLARAPRLRAIARAGAGHDAVDIAAATARGIAVSITPGANADSVAEQVFALLFALTRKVISNDQSVRAGTWDRRGVRPLRGTTLGIVGLGRCGWAVARRALAFGMRVGACGRFADDLDWAECGIVRFSFEELLASSDVVSVHLPLTADTRALFDRRAFTRMRHGALFINTARGALVVEQDLMDSLTSGHLAGAGLDVLSVEPPPRDDPLLSLPNVVFSPHVAGIDTAALDEMAEQAARCLSALRHGTWPKGCVLNEELRTSWRW